MVDVSRQVTFPSGIQDLQRERERERENFLAVNYYALMVPIKTESEIHILSVNYSVIELSISKLASQLFHIDQ